MFWCLLIYEGETDDCSRYSTKESEKNNTKIFHPKYGNEKRAFVVTLTQNHRINILFNIIEIFK